MDEVEAYPWKQRRDVKDIMLSLRKRVTGQRQEAMSLDRSLDMLDMEGSLSREAKKCLGHQRGNLLFKSPPTYTLLRAMFGQSVGGHACSFDMSRDEVDSSNSNITMDNEALAAFDALPDSDDEYTNDTRKSLSSPGATNDDQDREESFHWVNNELTESQDIEDELSTGKNRLGFRQRACVIKRKGQRSASEPVIIYPCNTTK